MESDSRFSFWTLKPIWDQHTIRTTSPGIPHGKLWAWKAETYWWSLIQGKLGCPQPDQGLLCPDSKLVEHSARSHLSPVGPFTVPKGLQGEMFCLVFGWGQQQFNGIWHSPHFFCSPLPLLHFSNVVTFWKCHHQICWLQPTVSFYFCSKLCF